MKLYNHPVSPFTRLCQVAINFTKIECESQDIDLFNGEQKQDWYQKINPKGKVPALEMDDGTTLTESTVIAKYIIRKAGGHSIYPDCIKTQAKIDEAICNAKELEWAYFPMTKFFGKPESEEGLKKVTDSFAKVSELCFSSGNTWMYGDSVTLADLELAIRISMALYIGEYDVEANYPALMKGYNEIMKMPEWASVHTKMMDTMAGMAAAMAAKKAAEAAKE